MPTGPEPQQRRRAPVPLRARGLRATVREARPVRAGPGLYWTSNGHHRLRALEAKLRMIQENLVLLVDLSQHRSTWRLELTVVLLIFFEIMISLWQIWRGQQGH